MVPVIESQSPAVSLLGAQQRELAERIASANTPGNQEGLFALHVIGQEPLFPACVGRQLCDGGVACSERLRLHQFPTLAALGYGLSLFRATVPPDADAAFADGAASLRTRPPFPRDRISFAYQPVAFLEQRA